MLGDLENLGLGLIENLPHAAAKRMKRAFRDLAAGSGEPSQYRALMHDLRIAADIGSRGNVLDQRREIAHTADVIELVDRSQRFGDGHYVGRLVVADELHDRVVEQAMGVAVKMIPAQKVGYPVGGAIVEQQTAEH